MLAWIIYYCLFMHVFATESFSCPAGFSCSKITGRSGGVEKDYKITPCPIGTYSQHGEGVCKSCEPGYYSVQNGSAACDPCPPGHECKHPNQNPRICPIGTYSSCIAQSVCTPCPTGKFVTDVGATHCIMCPAGSMCDSKFAGNLLSSQHKSYIAQFTGLIDPRWVLLYKATRDGFRGEDFHRKCNNHLRTVSVIKTTQNYLFGGYTSVAWLSSNAYRNDPNAFIFTLTNPNGISPTRYSIISSNMQYAIGDISSYGPTFGGGHDIYVPGSSNQTNGYTNFPHTYHDSTGKGRNTFTGGYNFVTSDIEVFQLY